MTENSGNDRRRDIKGRIDTLGTGTNGVSGRRVANRVGDRLTKRRASDDTERDGSGADASLADEEQEAIEDEQDAQAEAQEADAAVGEDIEEGEEELADEDEEELADEDEEELADEDEEDLADEDEEELADEDEEVDEDEAEEAEFGDDGAEAGDDAGEDDIGHEARASDVDKHSTLEVEIDPFVRAFAARRAAEKGDESLDEYIVGSVKGYLAGLLGGEVSSPGTLERSVDIETDDIFGGLLETVADDDESATDVVIDAIAEAHDVPVEEESLAVAGLRDHEALLNGVVANNSNDLDDVSNVVQAAVETRLIEEPA